MLFDQALHIPDILSSEALTVSLHGEKLRYNLRLKPSDLSSIKKATGLKLPSKMNASSIGKDVTCVKLGPDEWVLIANPAQAAKLEKSLMKISKDFICSVTDISHRNIAFTISGDDSSKLLNVGCPLDLSLDAFPVGKATRTVFESAAIMLLRTGEHSYRVECWRSFGPYLKDYFARVMTTG